MKILISQTASLGDVILSTPIISSLRRRYPQAEIWFLASRAGVELVKNNPYLSGVIPFDKKGKDASLLNMFRKAAEIRRQKFDCVYAIQRSARVGFLLFLAGIPQRIGFSSSAIPLLFTHTVTRLKDVHEVERNLSILSLLGEVDDRDKDLSLVAPPLESLGQDLQDALKPSNGAYIAIFPGSLWHTKRWHPENFAKLGLELKQQGLRPLFFGSGQEIELVKSCADRSSSPSFAGKTSLQEILYVISKAQALVCNDSSSLHIASAFKIPTISIFCATNPEMGFSSWRNPNSQVLEERNLWCRPCSRHGGTFCPTGTEACMSGMEGASVHAVLSAVLRACEH